MALGMLTAREIRARPGRAVLTLLSIVIGVGAIVSVHLATTSTRQAYRDMYERLSGKAALEVIGDSGGSFDQALVEKLRQIPGVQLAVPSVQQVTVLDWNNHRYRLLALGIDTREDVGVRDYRLAAGQFFDQGAGALLEANFAHSIGVKVGDTVRITTRLFPNTVQRATIVGLLAPQGVAGFAQGGVIFLPLETAQVCFKRLDQVDSVSLVLQPGADETAVQQAVARILPAGVAVRPPATRSRLAQATSFSVEQGLNFAGALIVLLGLFIILNTFLMNVGERRRQLAILRAIGATRGQIVRMLLFEGLLMGLAGTLLGSLAGVGGAVLLVHALAKLSSVPPPGITYSMAPFVWALVIGPGAALLGTYFPARLAGRISPLEGIRPMVSHERTPVPLWVTLTGLAMLAGGCLALLACIKGWLPTSWSILAGVVFLVSFVLILPAIMGPLARWVSMLLEPLWGVEAELARGQLVRRRVRSGLTVGVLYVAVSTGIGLGTTINNNVQDVRDWYRRTMPGDFFVRAVFPGNASGESVTMPIEYEKQLREIPGVANLDTMRFVTGRAGEYPVLIVVRGYTDPDFIPLDLARGNPRQVRQELLDGQVVLGTVLAQRLNLKLGDSITLETPSGPRAFRVAGTAIEYMVGGYAVYMQRGVAERVLHVDGADAFMIRARGGQLDAVQEQVRQFAAEHGLMVHSFAELTRLLDSIMTGVVRSLWGLLALGFVVSGFGIANTLTMNVLEQTREIALLRAVAMTRPQVRRMILVQAVMIGVVGLVTGTLAGINTAYFTSLAVEPLLGYPVTFSIHALLLLATFAIAMAIVLVAAWIPAHRATRINLLLALQYE